jgi:ABC-2 type transport system ATP-binding protein
MLYERSGIMHLTQERPAVVLEEVTKAYPGFRLGPVSFGLEPGYVTAVVGPNGSGKSTLFRLIMNLARPDGGEVRVLGGYYPGGDYPGSEVEIKQKIGYVPERAVGHDDWTARELGRFYARWYPSWNGSLYRELLERFEVPHDRRFKRLSKGLQRRLSFVLARSCEPELMLLDEPTDGVDPFARRAMVDEISAFMQSGERTVLFATHVMEEVSRLADYVVFLSAGEFLGFYEKDALLEEWRAFWVESPPDGAVPGVVSVEEAGPVRIVTRSPEETRAALEEARIELFRSEALQLEEILELLLRERRGARSRA